MQDDPVYDAPDTPPSQQPVHKPSLSKVSVLDRLIFTHSVWLQLSMNSATSLHILQRENPGMFLVRKSATSQRKVLSVRVADDSDPSFVQDFPIIEDSGNTAFSLEGSTVVFEDLFHLISFYCVTRDILPFTLKLPQAIASARSHKQLKTISHLGIEFWNSTLNVRDRQPTDPPEDLGSASPQEPGSPQGTEAGSGRVGEPLPPPPFGPLRTRTPGEVCAPAPNGALCFFNPLFAQQDPSGGKRGQFKRSFKVRVSTETSSPLSPPSQPPPPIPRPPDTPLAGTPCPGKVPSTNSDEASYQLPRTPVAPPRLKKKLRAAGGQGSEGYRVPAPSSGLEPDPGGPSRRPLTKAQRLSDLSHSSDDEGLGQLLGSPLPLIRDLTSQSLSSLEEEEEGEEAREEEEDHRQHPPSRSQGGHRVGWVIRGPIRKVTKVLSSFGSPERKLVRAVEERARDRGTYFGGLVQDYLGLMRQGKGQHASSSELLQSVRQFMSHMKMVLLHSSELDPTVEALVEEQERDRLLESAMHKSVLKPLRQLLYSSLQQFHTADGSLEQLKDNLCRVRKAGAQGLGVRASLPDLGTLEKIKLKFGLMQKTYSPVKKVHLLLHVCKLIYERLRTPQGEPYGADEFLPALSYVVAQCDLPELSLEVEYMMELLDQSELMGEGGYYLISLYTSMFELQNYHVNQPTIGIKSEIRHSLKQWHKRRRTCEAMPSVSDFQNFLRVAYEDPNHGCTAKTLVARPSDTAADLCRLCAEKFKVAEPSTHGLYLVVDDSCRPLPSDSHPQRIKAELKTQEEPGYYYYFVYGPVQQEAPTRAHRKLQRDNAVDLEDVPPL
ncbi:ras and Rab interactor 2-like [Pristis pectinata]|uniref:ras and Rab interactor 2-like n=1 Tax=Pristis pectinata TaxID=685728 RepID=UPI00223CC8CB|nr:ras and Rab interactor 2-like [Pristis pectinata]